MSRPRLPVHGLGTDARTGLHVSAPGPHRAATNRCPFGNRLTPKYLFDYYDRDLRFTLDLAADSRNALCERFISADEDALSYDHILEHVAWCNPPYGSESPLGPWVRKFAAFAHEGATVAALLPAATGTDWFRYMWETCDQLDFHTGGRHKFEHPGWCPCGKDLGSERPVGDSVVAIWYPGARVGGVPRRRPPYVQLVDPKREQVAAFSRRYRLTPVNR